MLISFSFSFLIFHFISILIFPIIFATDGTTSSAAVHGVVAGDELMYSCDFIWPPSNIPGLKIPRCGHFGMEVSAWRFRRGRFGVEVSASTFRRGRFGVNVSARTFRLVTSD